LFTGHTHWQSHGEEDGLVWITSGGGGGVTSDGIPLASGEDDAYGFVHFNVTRDALTFDMHSWGGMDNKEIIRATVSVTKKDGLKQVPEVQYFV